MLCLWVTNSVNHVMPPAHISKLVIYPSGLLLQLSNYIMQKIVSSSTAQLHQGPRGPMSFIIKYIYSYKKLIFSFVPQSIHIQISCKNVHIRRRPIDTGMLEPQTNWMCHWSCSSIRNERLINSPSPPQKKDLFEFLVKRQDALYSNTAKIIFHGVCQPTPSKKKWISMQITFNGDNEVLVHVRKHETAL